MTRYVRSVSIWYLIVSLMLQGCAFHEGLIRKTVLKAGPLTRSVPSAPTSGNDRRFFIGESYLYRIEWLGMPVGFVTFRIQREEVLNGRHVYVVTLEAETNKFADKIYRIRDKYTSFIDTKKLIPLRYDVDRSEGNYRKKATTLFDHAGGRAYFHNEVDSSSKEYEVPEGVVDPICAILRAKDMELNLGEYHVLHVANNESVYTINAVVACRDKVTLPDIGEFNAFFISPYAVLKGKRVKKGTVSGYISDDKNRNLLYAELKAPLFTKLTATLIETPGAGPQASGSAP